MMHLSSSTMIRCREDFKRQHQHVSAKIVCFSSSMLLHHVQHLFCLTQGNMFSLCNVIVKHKDCSEKNFREPKSIQLRNLKCLGVKSTKLMYFFWQLTKLDFRSPQSFSCDCKKPLHPQQFHLFCEIVSWLREDKLVLKHSLEQSCVLERYLVTIFALIS